ncbi:MAG TPA: hypothetical protein VFN20_01825, partial [Candidatus Acidoferrum sp.]|nr:hypothetical protein [Candidatus Acidoferrum sp.]
TEPGAPIDASYRLKPKHQWQFTLGLGQQSEIGTSQTNSVRQEMSAVGAKPDLRRTAGHLSA